MYNPVGIQLDPKYVTCTAQLKSQLRHIFMNLLSYASLFYDPFNCDIPKYIELIRPDIKESRH
jgi:hypothetical protein